MIAHVDDLIVVGCLNFDMQRTYAGPKTGFTKLARKSDGEDAEELMKYVFTLVMEMVLRDLTKSWVSRKFVWRLDDFVISAICSADDVVLVAESVTAAEEIVSEGIAILRVVGLTVEYRPMTTNGGFDCWLEHGGVDDWSGVATNGGFDGWLEHGGVVERSREELEEGSDSQLGLRGMAK